MKLSRKNIRPVLHLRHVDDENGVVLYDRYVYADTGIVCRMLGNVLEVKGISKDEITFLCEGDERGEVSLHPGESCCFVVEIPGLIADGSGWQHETVQAEWIPQEKTEGLAIGTMRKAIGIRLKKVERPSKMWTSRFFGMPSFSQKDAALACSDEGMFLAQINLYEARRFDSAGILPKGDWLYFFLHKDPDDPQGATAASTIQSWARTDHYITDFNENNKVFPNATDVWEAEFFEAEGDYPGTKLMGVPTGWPRWEKALPLLLQFNAADAPGVTGLPGDQGMGYLFFTGDMRQPEDCGWFSKNM